MNESKDCSVNTKYKKVRQITLVVYVDIAKIKK